jgi:uncharacterized protein with von Willebrand factor type A (vWA) domain
MNTKAIVSGSIAAIANRDGMSLAESFLNCEVIVLIDQSGSMGAKDAPGGLTRFDAADEELMRLQKAHPGQVAVISFSTNVQFNPGGLPNREGMTTDMAKALDFARIADGASRIVLISDGEPDSESATLEAARKYRHPIHTIYIGPEDSHGRAFLSRLASATGGRIFESAAPGLLAEGVTSILQLTA